MKKQYSHASTHEVVNQPPYLEHYNSFLADTALQESINLGDANWAFDDIARFGLESASAERIALGFDANHYKPELRTHDRYGHRIDHIDFHPAYHELMEIAISEGLHASPWREPKQGAHVARAAKYYLHTQVEAAHGCPITMTFAAIPALRHQPELLDRFGKKIMASEYDPSNKPDNQKKGLTVGMAMTEKQGGSDVRANTTRAYPLGQSGPGQAYELVGHKWFVSAPMCDLFLVLAQTESGVSCFLVPRWTPEGEKNPLQIQQLKAKSGNVANASSEAELRGALGWMVGEEGRGVRTIIEMVATTRYDCMIGSSAGMRQAVVQAVHHCRYRSAFGDKLSQQPLMQNLLADLAIESEAALQLTMRMSRAFDQADNEREKLLARVATPVGKYWICKRTPNHAYEAMEVIGGMGVMDTHITSRLYREAPINAIWEGSGNVQCLDILRVMQKSPDAVQIFLEEVALARGENHLFDAHLKALHAQLKQLMSANPVEVQLQARRLADDMAVALQASLLLRYSSAEISYGYCASRLGQRAGHNYGCLPSDVQFQAILERSFTHS
ncbi:MULTISPECIES: acyl-CoA dehydrogenase family protein [Gammaproteobacteria]|uniref:acyl-CoA dehydrogenase family protein n=1 Tax=Gammaproteobacteria TaxID=1236 RepID=UPI000DD0388D|nr:MULTISPECIES: acyl-CoA dehydrogenase family protein [Gammaproteobacteria]RTE87059.1 DNA alkylation response protein [Aliidiomarina sp. B3213]TCZ93151.1 DNA alkylation response protein [Lysobacter sp. N42]